MTTSIAETAAPSATYTVDQGIISPPAVAFVILWSAAQPHRIGESAFLPTNEWRFVGRGDDAIEEFLRFAPQLPGEIQAVDPREGLLTGDSLSRRSAKVRTSAVLVEIERTGKSVMLVNGVECQSARLKSGDTVMFKGELLLLCVWRPRTLPLLDGFREPHVFGEPDSAGMTGESAEVWRLRAELARVALTDDHAFIEGETGTGKELSALALHLWSNRANGPFVPFNAADLSPTLVASELFGNPANYPNHGMPARKGLLAEADRGTLFIDEIADLPPEAQAALLRALQSGEYRPVGESKPRRVNVRIVGATNRGQAPLRSDFPARFPVRIRTPPLRERREDIPHLIRQWLLQRAKKYPELKERFIRTGPSGRLEPRVSSRLVDYLVRQPLPLNIRELHAVLLKAVDASHGDVVRLPQQDPTPVPSAPPSSKEQADGHAIKGSPSKEQLIACIDRERGNIVRVGKALGLHRNAVYRLMKSYGIDKKRIVE